MRWTAVVLVALRLVASFALWLLLVDDTSEPNMLAGAVCAVLATGLATRVQSLRTVHAAPRPAMLRHAYRPLALLVVDSGRVARALIARGILRRPVHGRWRAVRYRSTGEEAADVARRVLTEWGASLGPNRYVIGIDAEDDVLLVHELVPASGPIDPLELG